MEEQTPFCRSCFKQAGGRFLILCLEIQQCLSRSLPEQGSGNICSPVPCFPGCRSDPDPGRYHPPTPTSLPPVLSALRVWSKEAGEGFWAWIFCERGSWKTRLNAFLTFHLPFSLSYGRKIELKWREGKECKYWHTRKY